MHVTLDHGQRHTRGRIPDVVHVPELDAVEKLRKEPDNNRSMFRFFHRDHDRRLFEVGLRYIPRGTFGAGQRNGSCLERREGVR